VNADLKAKWDIKDVDKTAFFEQAQATFGGDLAKLMTSAIEETKVAKVEVELVGNGHFIDDYDLEEKYKNKPARLAAIKKNGRKVFDSVSECWLTEDMEYKSSTSASQTHTKGIKRTGEVEERVKKAKAPKVQKEIADGVQQDGDPPRRRRSQKNRGNKSLIW